MKKYIIHLIGEEKTSFQLEKKRDKSIFELKGYIIDNIKIEFNPIFTVKRK